MLPHEVMERLPYRWYRILLAWLNEDFERPNRTDHYLMQIPWRVSRMFGGKTELNDYRLTRQEENLQDKLPPEVRRQLQHAVWIGRLGGKVKVVRKPRDE